MSEVQILKQWQVKDLKVTKEGESIFVSSDSLELRKEYTDELVLKEFGLKEAYEFLEIEQTEEEKASRYFWHVGNKFARGFGRPKKYTDPYELEYDIINYFEYCQGEYEDREVFTTETKTTGKGDNSVTITTESTTVRREAIREREEPSITGLCLHLNFSSRDTLYNYMKDEEGGFSDSIKRGLLHVENNYEKGLWTDKPAGVIFALKNMGWKDKSEVENTVVVEQPYFLDNL